MLFIKGSSLDPGMRESSRCGLKIVKDASLEHFSQPIFPPDHVAIIGHAPIGEMIAYNRAMRIRDDQLTALGEVRLMVFVQRLTDHLKNDFAADLASHGIAKSQVPQQVRDCIALAGSFGVEAESDMWLFGECVAIFGPQFPRTEDWAQEELERRDKSGTEKMDKINQYMLFSLKPPR
jgi:hypothetical protein